MTCCLQKRPSFLIPHVHCSSLPIHQRFADPLEPQYICFLSESTHNNVQRPPKACRVLSIDSPLPLRMRTPSVFSLLLADTIYNKVQWCTPDKREQTSWQHTSSSVSNLQLLPSSVTSFHHLSPTNKRPATFFVCMEHDSHYCACHRSICSGQPKHKLLADPLWGST